MDDIRDSLSGMKKKFKQRLTGRKHKTDGTGTNPGGERADSTSLLLQQDPHVAMGESYGREGDGANAGGERAFSTDRPQTDGPEPVTAHESDNGQERGKADVDGGEASQNLHPHPDVEVAVDSGRSGELEGVNPSPSTPSISDGERSDGTWTWSFWSPPLIVTPDNVGTALPDDGPGVVRPDETPEPSATADEKKSKSGSTVADAMVELLRGVRDSAGAFSPLRSVARSLCFILNSCEVWPPSRTFGSQCLRSL